MSELPACPKCGSANPEGAKFCGSCGAGLSARCGRCGQANPPDGTFCLECGAPLAAVSLPAEFTSPQTYTPPHLADKIRAGREELENERKQITVLFADVAGYTSISERLDPEDTHEIMRRCFDLMLEEVHTTEGTVSQFLGDGMMALFGAPITHEDHAQRAIRAALGIQQRLGAYQDELAERGIDFRVRIGLNSGPVVVGNVGADLTMSYQAVGDTVNVASRMEGLAPPGSVVVSESTYKLAEGYFEFRDLGLKDVKGKEKAIGVYEVLRPVPWRSRVDVYAERGLGSFVGRDDELETLLGAVASARSGTGQVVFLKGEAGIGKSRMLYELRSRLEDEDVRWLTGRCISYGGNIPYLPIVDVVKDSFGIEESDSEEEVARKVVAGAPVGGAPYLRHLLGVDPGDEAIPGMDAQLRKARTFEALRELALAGAAEQPRVIAIEDLHWVDQASTEFMSYFFDAIHEHPIIVLLTHRPDWNQPLGARPFFTHVELTPLSAGDSERVAEGVLGPGEVPPELEQLVYRKAEGNPFFIEEVVRSLVETGTLRKANSHYELARSIEEIHVPDTVQDVIMARLDRLSDDPKRAIQTASVIGREFTARLLERISDLPSTGEPLSELKAVELIHERSLYPELQYMFKHALTHDVAYASLMLTRRKELHRIVAVALEDLYADRLIEHYEAIAFHAEQGEDWERAFTYLGRSGDKALAAFAPQQAVDFFDRALALAGDARVQADPEALIRLHFGRGQALFLLSSWEESAASYEAMHAEAQRAGDPIQEGVALFNAALSFLWAHRFEDAMSYAERARAIGREHGAAAIVAGALITIEGVYSVTGQRKKRDETLDEALHMARESQVPVLEGVSLVWSGFGAHWDGDELDALDQWNEGTEIGRRHELPVVLLWTLWTQALSLCGQGRYNEALESLQEHMILTGRLGDRVFRCRTLNTLGWLYMDLCNWDLAVEHNLRGAKESREVGDPEIIRNAELNLGDCALVRGDLDEAQRWLETVEEESKRSGAWGEDWMKWRYSQHTAVSLGELWLARGDAAKALRYADACIEAAADAGSLRNVTKGRRVRAEALLAQGSPEEAARELETALRAAREVGNPAQIWKTLVVQARALSDLGRSAGASAAAGEALEAFEAVAAGLADDGLRETMLASPQAEALRDA